MKTTKDLIETIKTYAQSIDSTIAKQDFDLTNSLARYLSNNKFEVKKNVKLSSINDVSGSINNHCTISNVLVRIGTEFVPVEIKVNGEIQEYKRLINQIQNYIQDYDNVSCSLVIFVSHNSLEKDIYNLHWKIGKSAKQDYKYIIAKYATNQMGIFISKKSRRIILP